MSLGTRSLRDGSLSVSDHTELRAHELQAVHQLGLIRIMCATQAVRAGIIKPIKATSKSHQMHKGVELT